MTALERMQDLLPAPYSVAGDALLTGILNVCALEVESLEESVDRLRRSHWIEHAYRDIDIDQIAALTNIRRFPGEPAVFFRPRLLALIVAQWHGTIAVPEIAQFARDYIAGVENTFKCTLIPGLRNAANEEERRKRGPLVHEFPERVRGSRELADRGGRVTHLFRWRVENRGLVDAPLTFTIRGALGRRTMMPALINHTTETIYVYRGVVPTGTALILEQIEGVFQATLDGRDVTPRLHALPFTAGAPLTLPPVAAPLQLTMPRGPNEWQFAAIGFYGERGFDNVHFRVDDPALTEGAFDSTAFDHALFREDPAAWVEMQWVEREPAAFDVVVQRPFVIEPKRLRDDFILAGATRPPHEEVAADLTATVMQLRAAGVRAGARFVPFRAEQPQITHFQLAQVVVPPESGSAGEDGAFGTGGRFGESPLDQARFN